MVDWMEQKNVATGQQQLTPSEGPKAPDLTSRLGTSVAALFLFMFVHVTLAIGVYLLVVSVAPSWAAVLLALITYWVIRNRFVISAGSWVRRSFRAAGERHRAEGRRLAPVLRAIMPLTVSVYGDPLGAYDGVLDPSEVLLAQYAEQRRLRGENGAATRPEEQSGRDGTG